MFLDFYKAKAFGLDISDHSIEIIALKGSMEKPKLSAMGRGILEPGIVKDGRILEKEKLRTTLENLIKNSQFGQIKTKKFIFSFPESKSFIHTFEMPKALKGKGLKEEIERQASHNFPFPLAELYFDFKMEDKEILLVAVPKNIVDDFLEVFKKLKLKPVALEIESLSLARSLLKNKKETTLIADIGAKTTNFSIFDKKGLRLSITIDIAGNKFTKALASKLNISSSQAEGLKKEVGLNPNKKEGKVFLILQKEIQKVISEIKKIDEYFQEKEGKSFEKIILAGGSSTLPHLVDYLAENLEIPVVVGDPWEKINIDLLKKKEYFKEAFKVNPILYATVIGSAFRGLAKSPEKTDINLIKNLKT